MSESGSSSSSSIAASGAAGGTVSAISNAVTGPVVSPTAAARSFARISSCGRPTLAVESPASGSGSVSGTSSSIGATSAARFLRIATATDPRINAMAIPNPNVVVPPGMASRTPPSSVDGVSAGTAGDASGSPAVGLPGDATGAA